MLCPFSDCRGRAFPSPETAYEWFCGFNHVWIQNDPENPKWVVGLSHGRVGRYEAMLETDPRFIELERAQAQYPAGRRMNRRYDSQEAAQARVEDILERNRVAASYGYGQGRYQGD